MQRDNLLDNLFEKPTIQVIGWYGKGNLGDDLFIQAMQNLFADFYLVFSDGAITPGAVAVILGPGDVMDPWYLREYDGSIPLLAFGVGFRVKGEVELLSKVHFSHIVFRTTADQVVARNYGFDSSLAPDPVFSLYPTVLRREGERGDKKALLICNEEINARWKNPSPSRLALFSYATYFSEVLAKGFSLIENEFWTVWPVMSEQTPNDESMILDIASRFEQPLLKQDIVRFKSQTDIREVFSSARFCMSMRLHGVILSLLHEVPVVALSVGRKIDALMTDLGLEDWLIPADSLSWVRLEEQIERIQHSDWSSFSEKVQLEQLGRRVIEQADICREIVWSSFKRSSAIVQPASPLITSSL